MLHFDQQVFQGVTTYALYFEATIGVEESASAEFTKEGGPIGATVGVETKQVSGETHHVVIYGNIYKGQITLKGAYLPPEDIEE